MPATPATPAAPIGSPGQRLSAFERLRSLPKSFSIEQLSLLCDLAPHMAAKYASRWIEAGLIVPAGPRVGYYANLVADPAQSRSSAWRTQALLYTYPSATVVGASVLASAGWVTQIPRETQIAVLAPARRARIDGFDVSARTRRWFERTHAFCRPGEQGLRELTPAMALADAYARADTWHPDPDDLEIPTEELPELVSAFGALGAAMPEHLRELVDGDMAGDAAASAACACRSR